MRAWVSSRRNELRLARARAFLDSMPASAEVLVVGPTFEAVAELTRSLKRTVFGWRRTTLYRLALEWARPQLIARGLTPVSGLALEAFWVRVVHQLGEARQLHRLTSLEDSPGLPGALSKTVSELRMLGVPHTAVEPALGQAMQFFDAALAEANAVDEVQVYQLAAQTAEQSPGVTPALLLDVAAQPGAERAFLDRLVRDVSPLLVVSPADEPSMAAFWKQTLGLEPEMLCSPSTTALEALQHRLFSDAESDGTSFTCEDFFSAPGEARECAEIARRALHWAQRGIAFDSMAVFLRRPELYRDVLDDVFRRAGIPTFFEAGLERPDVAGRALLSLLNCALEGLSAKRMGEYLSLGQVPPSAAAEGALRESVPSRANSVLPLSDVEPSTHLEEEVTDVEAPSTAGHLRAPRRWERLIVDAAVIGGLERWHRRLRGLRQRKVQAAGHAGATEAQQAHVERELGDLDALEDFVLPLLADLAALPAQALWGEWLARLSALTARAVRRPERVLALLEELAPLSPVGPVTLSQVRATLAPRLKTLTVSAQGRRAGSVFVGTTDSARARAVAIAFIPGLAERVFPQKFREDPLCPDASRLSLHHELETAQDKVAFERLQLLNAVGAATQRAILSFPRLDADQGRPRVPSFYVLEAVRAVQGAFPNYEFVQRQAELVGHARLAWPAPRNPFEAIDDAEYDLAVLGEHAQSSQPRSGCARYLVHANAHVNRALRARFARWQQSQLTASDGLLKLGGAGREALARHQLAARSFSPTSLEQFAACPYRFYLSAVVRLHPRETAGELEQLGPLEKGTMAHRIQFELLSELKREGVPVTQDTLEEVMLRLKRTIARVAAHVFDDFKPAIERIWLDGLEVLEADLRQWLRLMADDARWRPAYFELSFGLPGRGDDEQDEASQKEPIHLMEELSVRGSIDLVERDENGCMRATDYKTGRVRAQPGNLVGGGRHLQPLLYALVLEKMFPNHAVEGGRFYYSTQVGGYTSVSTPLDAASRDAFGQVVRTLRRSLEEGFFPAAPDRDECRYCQFRPICGPDEERRLMRTRKALRVELQPLRQLRAMR